MLLAVTRSASPGTATSTCAQTREDIFYRTIRDFFCQIPPRHWACIEGRPIVQLYEAAFASGHDQSTLDYVYEHFGGTSAAAGRWSWRARRGRFKADLSTGWGAALNGPILPTTAAARGRTDRGAVQIGPGYETSP